MATTTSTTIQPEIPVLTYLHTIQALSREWYTVWDTLHDGGQTQALLNIDRTHNHDGLPHNLDRIVDTDQTTKTRHGAVVKLRKVWFYWGKPRPPKSIDGDEYDLLCAALIAHTARLNEIKPDTLEATQKILRKLAQDAQRATAHGAENTHIACPECETGTLEQPYTSDGLMDGVVCAWCGQYWSIDDIIATAKARARLGLSDCQVTLAEASNLLGIDIKTLFARVKRSNIQPVADRKRKMYSLLELRTA